MSNTKDNNQSTLAKGMFVKSHTFKTGTTVQSLSIDVVEFCNFAKENLVQARNGRLFLNLKLIPNRNEESKFSHTPIVNDYFKTDDKAGEAFKSLVSDIFPEEIDDKIAEKEQLIIKADKRSSRKTKAKA